MDEANGFLYFGSRYYATEVGRFITKASTTGKDGDSQSLNQYIYALNNPVNAGFPIPMAKPPAPGAEAIENTSLNVINAAGNGDGSGSCNLVPDLLR
jgi:uncharacterized protein RhaS with RHS repeats